METEYDRYDCLRYELFETLIPAMLYKGTEKEIGLSLIDSGYFIPALKTIINDM